MPINWASEVDARTGRPIESPFARYEDSNVNISPGPGGAHNWQSMAYNPQTGLVYIPARQDSFIYGQPHQFKFNEDPRSWNTGTFINPDNPTNEGDFQHANYGKLIAWDPVNQEERWHVTYPSTASSGILTTPGFVFQGSAEGNFVAFDSKTGEELWSFPLETGIIAPPVTYLVDGIQYITIGVGWGGVEGIFGELLTEQINPGTIYTFALGKHGKIPDFPKQEPKQLVDLPFNASVAELANGEQLFEKYCGFCHLGGIIPDLTYSTAEIFNLLPVIVGEGAFLAKGMPNYEDRLSDQDILDVKHYILSLAQQKISEQIKKE